MYQFCTVEKTKPGNIDMRIRTTFLVSGLSKQGKIRDNVHGGYELVYSQQLDLISSPKPEECTE